jgi:hypothetical protein
VVAKWVKSMADRGGHREIGYPNPTAMLTHLGRMSGGHAHTGGGACQRIRQGSDGPRGLGRRSALTDQTRPLFAAAEGVPDGYREAEDRLVDIVEGLSMADTGRPVEYWRQSVDGPERSTSKPGWSGVARRCRSRSVGCAGSTAGSPTLRVKDSKPCWTPS